MHSVDPTTEQMIRSVLAYAENRLRMNPVPLDRASVPTDKLYERLSGIITEAGRPPDEVLGVLMDELRQRGPDRIVFSGDATALGFASEFERAAELLRVVDPQGPPGLG